MSLAVRDPKVMRQAEIVRKELIRAFDELPTNPKKEKDIMYVCGCVVLCCVACVILMYANDREMFQDREELIRTGYLDVNQPIPTKRNVTFLHMVLSSTHSLLHMVRVWCSVDSSPSVVGGVWSVGRRLC